MDLGRARPDFAEDAIELSGRAALIGGEYALRDDKAVRLLRAPWGRQSPDQSRSLAAASPRGAADNPSRRTSRSRDLPAGIALRRQSRRRKKWGGNRSRAIAAPRRRAVANPCGYISGVGRIDEIGEACRSASAISFGIAWIAREILMRRELRRVLKMLTTTVGRAQASRNANGPRAARPWSQGDARACATRAAYANPRPSARLVFSADIVIDGR